VCVCVCVCTYVHIVASSGHSKAERTGAVLRHLYFCRGEFRIEKLRNTEPCERGERSNGVITKKGHQNISKAMMTKKSSEY